MRTWKAGAWLSGRPDDVLERLTDPDSIGRWAPVEFDVVSIDDDRLRTGTRATVRGSLAGRCLDFEVLVHEAGDDGLVLVAEGPITLAVDYRLLGVDCGTEVQAAITVSGNGLRGRLLAGAADALLAGGALQFALHRIGADLELSLA